MKTIKLIIMILLTTITVYSQETIYKKILGLDKFVGKWNYSVNGQNLTLELSKIKYTNKWLSMDMIVGRHLFQKENKVIDKTQISENTITTGVLNPEDENVLNFNFHNGNSTLYGTGRLTFKKGSPDILILNLSKGATRYPARQKSFDLPTSIELRKVKE